MRSRIRWAAIAAVLAVGLVTTLGACTSSGGGSSSSAAGGAGRLEQLGAARAAPAAPPAASAGAAARGSLTGAGAAGGEQPVLTSGAAEIKTADITVGIRHAGDVAAKADAADQIALGLGGSVDTDDRTSGRFASATLVLRVPPDQLESLLTQLSRLGVERSRHSTTQNVTGKVADVNSRVTSAQAAITQLTKLYNRAKKVSDIITIENELAQRESDLEALQAEQRALHAQTSMATVTLQLITLPRKTPPPPVKKHTDGGFLGGLKNGWHAFAHGAQLLATAVGAVLPFALLAAALAAIARLLWPRWRRRTPTAPTPASTTSPTG